MKNTPNECIQKMENEKEYKELKNKLDNMETEADICIKFINDMKADKKRCLKICKAEKSVLYSKKCKQNLCGQDENK